jgi:hypothetical protein
MISLKWNSPECRVALTVNFKGKGVSSVSGKVVVEQPLEGLFAVLDASPGGLRAEDLALVFAGAVICSGVAWQKTFRTFL